MDIGLLNHIRYFNNEFIVLCIEVPVSIKFEYSNHKFGIVSAVEKGSQIYYIPNANLIQDEREVVPQDTVAIDPMSSVVGGISTSHHGIEVAVEFKPVEHPVEPLDIDQPIQCPLPEPSILNDGRIWKERVSSGVHRKAELSIMEEEAGGPPQPETPRMKSRPRTNRMILPSISAPEHNILKLLEESGMWCLRKMHEDSTMFLALIVGGAFG